MGTCSGKAGVHVLMYVVCGTIKSEGESASILQKRLEERTVLEQDQRPAKQDATPHVLVGYQSYFEVFHRTIDT